MDKGFTLIEALVTILIVSFIILGMLGLFGYVRVYYDINLVSLNLQRQARQGMSWLSREIRGAYWDYIVPGPRDPDGTFHSITFYTPDVPYASSRLGVRYYVTTTSSSDPREMLWQLERVCDYPTNTLKTRAFSVSKSDTNFPPGLMLNFSQGSGNILNITVTVSKTFFPLGKRRTLTFSLTEQAEVRN